MLHANSMLFHIWDLANDYGVCRGAVLELTLTESKAHYVCIYLAVKEMKNEKMLQCSV